MATQQQRQDWQRSNRKSWNKRNNSERNKGGFVS